MDCLFCKIASREIKSNIIYENDKVVVFPDIHPRAPLHLLIVPKEHVADLTDLEKKDIWSTILNTIKILIIKENIAKKGYRIVINGGGA